MIYFDNAATSFPKPPQVARAVAEAINSMGVPHRGSHPLAVEASRVLYACRTAVAELFFVQEVSSVVFTSGATESLNTAINGLLTENDHVITTASEHNAVLRPLYRLGCALDIIPCDPSGQPVLDDLKNRLNTATKAVVCGHMSNVTGNVVDVAFLSRFCHDNGLYLILDGAQSAGCLFMEAELADVFCFTGHKSLFGPQGTGGMVIRRGTPVKPLKVGGTGHRAAEHAQPAQLPDRLEAGTHNGHGLAGLLAGLNFIQETSIPVIIEKETRLMRRFVDGVSTLSHIKLYGDFNQPERGAIVSLQVDGYSSSEVSEILAADYNMATRPGLHCAPLIHHALGTDKTGLTRFSFSYFNTEAEIDCALEALAAL